MSPTSLTLRWLRAEGYQAEVVERWVPTANCRRDLFHCIDVLAIRADAPGCFGIQCTVRDCMAARLIKMQQPEHAAVLRVWLAAGNRLSVVGWSKEQVRIRTLFGRDRRGRALWTPCWRHIAAADLEPKPEGVCA